MINNKWKKQKMKLYKNMENNFGNCNRNTLLPYEYESTCISCGFNLIKKHELTKIQRKKLFSLLD